MRITHCWDCGRSDLNDAEHETCPACGWIICPTFGACTQFGCFSNTPVTSLYERQRYRKLWLELPADERPDAKNWVTIVYNRERKKKHEEELMALSRLDKILSDAQRCGVIHVAYGRGEIVSIERKSSFCTLHVSFENGKEADFLYPSSFTDGFLAVSTPRME